MRRASKINVTGEFHPASPIPVERQNGAYGVVAVNYANGLTPSLDDFAPYRITDVLTASGQTFIWTEAKAVYFSDEDGTVYAAQGVVAGEKIDSSNLPSPVKAGYTLLGWQAEGADALWNFDTDIVSEGVNLLAVWSLNAPAVSVTADTASIQEGEGATLTATPSHEAEGVTYLYQWYKDGALLEGETNSTLYVSAGGSYTVQVKVSDGSRESVATESTPVVITMVESPAGTDPEPSEPAETPEADIPETSDNNDVFLWIALALVTGGIALALTLKRKKQRI